MKVYLPSNNPLSQGYSAKHKGYDFRGLNLPDEVRAGKDGVIVERVDSFTTNWTNNGTLTTRDYGNYIKIKHDDGTFELHAHLKKGSSLVVGTRVKAGQVVARIGNTGNSTGPHLHSKYRYSNGVNTEVEFYTVDDSKEALEKELAEANKQIAKLQEKVESLSDGDKYWKDALKLANLPTNSKWSVYKNMVKEKEDQYEALKNVAIDFEGKYNTTKTLYNECNNALTQATEDLIQAKIEITKCHETIARHLKTVYTLGEIIGFLAKAKIK